MADTNPTVKKPPMKKRGPEGGRPAVDYELLFDEWVRSGLPRIKFLEDYGLDPDNATVKRKTRTWNKDTRKAAQALKKSSKNAGVQPRPQKEIAELWQIVQNHRRNIGVKDFNTANKLRIHLERILDGVEGKLDSEGQPYTFSALDLSRLADVATKVQKIQRLALGMTTENVGIPKIEEPEPHVEGDGTNTPIFIVEVNKNGKFIRPKPRQIQ
jgi:hypothetical protein